MWVEAKYDFVIRAKHIAGITNRIFDTLSRSNLQTFGLLVPQSDLTPTSCLPASDLMMF